MKQSMYRRRCLINFAALLALFSLAFQRAGFYTEKTGPAFFLVLVGSILIAGLSAALLGLLVGIPALRLKGDYLAIITLGFGMIIVNIINNLPFCGQQGLSQGSASSVLSTSSFAFTNGSILNSVFIVVMVVVGGMGSLTGSVIAAVVLFLLNYAIKNGGWVAVLPAFLQNVFTYPMLVYSIALIIVILFRPRGIMGSREFALCDVPKWPGWIRAHFASRDNSAGKGADTHA